MQTATSFFKNANHPEFFPSLTSRWLVFKLYIVTRAYSSRISDLNLILNDSRDDKIRLNREREATRLLVCIRQQPSKSVSFVHPHHLSCLILVPRSREVNDNNFRILSTFICELLAVYLLQKLQRNATYATNSIKRVQLFELL